MLPSKGAVVDAAARAAARDALYGARLVRGAAAVDADAVADARERVLAAYGAAERNGHVCSIDLRRVMGGRRPRSKVLSSRRRRALDDGTATDRRSRGVLRPRNISAAPPRRGRDPPPRNIRAAPRGGAATRLHLILLSRTDLRLRPNSEGTTTPAFQRTIERDHRQALRRRRYGAATGVEAASCCAAWTTPAPLDCVLGGVCGVRAADAAALACSASSLEDAARGALQLKQIAADEAQRATGLAALEENDMVLLRCALANACRRGAELGRDPHHPASSSSRSSISGMRTIRAVLDGMYDSGRFLSRMIRGGAAAAPRRALASFRGRRRVFLADGPRTIQASRNRDLPVSSLAPALPACAFWRIVRTFPANPVRCRISRGGFFARFDASEGGRGVSTSFPDGPRARPRAASPRTTPFAGRHPLARRGSSRRDRAGSDRACACYRADGHGEADAEHQSLEAGHPASRWSSELGRARRARRRCRRGVCPLKACAWARWQSFSSGRGFLVWPAFERATKLRRTRARA